MKLSVDKEEETKTAANLMLAVLSWYVRGQVNILKSKDN